MIILYPNTQDSNSLSIIDFGKSSLVNTKIHSQYMLWQNPYVLTPELITLEYICDLTCVTSLLRIILFLNVYDVMFRKIKSLIVESHFHLNLLILFSNVKNKNNKENPIYILFYLGKLMKENLQFKTHKYFSHFF